MTLLNQDEPGLQIPSPTKEWIGVPSEQLCLSGMRGDNFTTQGLLPYSTRSSFLNVNSSPILIPIGHLYFCLPINSIFHSPYLFILWSMRPPSCREPLSLLLGRSYIILRRYNFHNPAISRVLAVRVLLLISTESAY